MRKHKINQEDEVGIVKECVQGCKWLGGCLKEAWKPPLWLLVQKSKMLNAVVDRVC